MRLENTTHTHLIGRNIAQRSSSPRRTLGGGTRTAVLATFHSTGLACGVLAVVPFCTGSAPENHLGRDSGGVTKRLDRAFAVQDMGVVGENASQARGIAVLPKKDVCVLCSTNGLESEPYGHIEPRPSRCKHMERGLGLEAAIMQKKVGPHHQSHL